jgi:hypothetical protein
MKKVLFTLLIILNVCSLFLSVFMGMSLKTHTAAGAGPVTPAVESTTDSALLQAQVAKDKKRIEELETLASHDKDLIHTACQAFGALAVGSLVCLALFRGEEKAAAEKS